ncbi:MAG: ribosomal RNA small subunit methyltransferase A [Candidatus Wildermuthbacteria bacterium RIFCSPHIGHO2_02_FULL_47_12]|uniref:Ribosomal RNA small subunit methyltransferase A n=1 Tax=Candidatus Wildermuthbacteria bacterium RIFCSPHIGHO2_02_FULL_47_12 TaxID=1802451 RepID=A0A1G2R5Q1_9BACT|nr:MAG: ribosomal RNA small subunit methyltransferase A [Candidatus Wildermuthbacteria bacterium RIFCSPHIGHO2_02_FULL_47_12]
MDLFSIKTIKELLTLQGARPRKGLGQNFLISKGVLADILKAANLTKEDTVLEIGSGIGTLTRTLAQSAKKVVAVEKDHAMVKILKETTKDLSHIEVIRGDILSLVKLSFAKLSLTKDYKVVANLPYYITSPVIRLFLEAENKPELLVLMVQKEVSQRICAKPPKMSLLAVAVQFYATPSIISYVKKNCFWPQPKVDSAILKIIPHKQNLGSLSYPNTNPHLREPKFFEVVKAGFKQPRKQLGNNLASGLKLSRQQVETWLTQAGIQPAQRAETLSVQDWLKLSLTKVGIT